jgi:hypothetical protein
MKKALFSFGAITLSLLLASCGSSSSNSSSSGSQLGQNIPIYQGMTMSTASSTTKQAHLDASDSNSSVESSSSTDSTTSSSSVSSSSETPTADDGGVVYYGDPGSSVLIDVHVRNPNQYEILSFTLNAYKYQSYQFQDGSDSENLYLKLNLPETSGYASYSIDAIKYIDGTETKDANMSEAAKTVKAGVTYKVLPTAAIDSEEVSYTSYATSFLLGDEFSLVKDKGFTVTLLNQSGDVVESSLRNKGTGTISFNSLQMETPYECKITAKADILDGEGEKEIVLSDKKFTTKAGLTIDSLTPGKEDMSYKTTSRVDGLVIKSVKVTNAKGEVISSGTKAEDKLTGLLTDTSYTMTIDYSYGAFSGTKSQTFKTLSNLVPTAEFTSVTSDKTSISYSFNWSDGDSVGTFKGIELKKGDESVKTSNKISDSFTGLLSNNTYSVVATYSYDLKDGAGLMEKSVVYPLSTKAKSIPTYELSAKADETEITFDVTSTDGDSIGTINSMKLIRDGSTVQTIESGADKKFSGLLSYTSYKVQVAYSYDLNDGNGVHNAIIEKDIKTSPHFALTETTVINTSAVSEGDTIVIQANVDNPQNAIPVSVDVNGATYLVASTSTTSKIRVEITNNGQFKGGNTELTIGEIKLSLDGSSYGVSLNSNNKGNVFVNGKITFKDASFARKLSSGTYEETDWFLLSEQMYMYITFDNPTGYTIDSVTTVNGSSSSVVVTSFETIDANHIAIPFTGETKKVWRTISKVTYSNIYLSSKTLICGEKVYGYRCVSDEIKSIKTASDLLNCDDGYYYKLQNDIDLKGTEWTGGDLKGVFDGNGYTISNMSVVATFADSSKNFGLFQTALGAIFNVKIKDALYMVTMTNSTSSNFWIYCGAISGESSVSESLSIKSCMVADCFFEITASSKFNVYAGGLIGYAYTTHVSNSSFSGSIELVTNSSDGYSKSFYVGGIFGGGTMVTTYNGENSCSIDKCFSVATLIGFGRTGGVCGTFYSGSISNSLALNLKNSESSLHGFANDVTRTLLTNCFYNGGTDDSNATKINNLFELTGKWFEKTLEFDPTIWDLTDVDVPNGKLPTLKDISQT